MMLGDLGAHFLAKNKAAKLAAPNPTSVHSKVPPACQPVSAGNCEAMIKRPAACVKPIMTGELMRLRSQP
jgi:hypothetical protein